MRCLSFLLFLKEKTEEQTLKQYIESHPKSKVALQEWTSIVRKSKWNSFADVKATFNSVDNVGNQHYVFNVKGNTYRIVAVIKFTIKFVYIRFVGNVGNQHYNS